MIVYGRVLIICAITWLEQEVPGLCYGDIRFAEGDGGVFPMSFFRARASP